MVDVSWFGGIINFTIPTYVIIGLLLIIFGVLIGAFVPNVGRKFGSIMFVAGLILTVAFPLLGEWWQNDVFKIIVIGVAVFGIIIFVLFAGVPTPTGNKGGRKK